MVSNDQIRMTKGVPSPRAELVIGHSDLGRCNIRRWPKAAFACSTIWANACRIADGHLGQHLAVEFDAGFGQPVDELAVSQPMLGSGGTQSNDPQPAEFTLPDAAVAESVNPRSNQCLFRGSQQLARVRRDSP